MNMTQNGADLNIDAYIDGGRDLDIEIEGALLRDLVNTRIEEIRTHEHRKDSLGFRQSAVIQAGQRLCEDWERLKHLLL